MTLEMYLGGILIDSKELDEPVDKSVAQKENFYRCECERFYRRNHFKIRKAGIQPKFYVTLQSKMNEMILA